MEIIIGTYEAFLLGYVLRKDEEAGYSLQQTFAISDHNSPVRCLAACGHFISSGSVDEFIHIYNMKSRTEVGILEKHEGTITSLQFATTKYLITTSEDGYILIWKTGSNWTCEKTLSGHKGFGVTSLALHPSNKLLLSTGKDKKIKTWNLIKGRLAYISKTKEVAENIQWSPKGDHFMVSFDKSVDVYDIGSAGIVHSVSSTVRIQCSDFIDEDLIAIGKDGGCVEIHSFKEEKLVFQFKAHDVRVKGIASFTSPKNKKHTWIVTASSSGQVRVWDLKDKTWENDPVKVTEINASCRVTCLTLSKEDVPVSFITNRSKKFKKLKTS